MTFTVESCWGGNSAYSFRITGPDDYRISLACKEGENWNRNAASVAKDRICRDHGIDREDRNRIRFSVR